MPIPTEPIGSIPRPPELLEGIEAFATGNISREDLDARYDDAVRDTIASLEAAGSPVVTDGEQRKPSFVTYPIDGERVGDLLERADEAMYRSKRGGRDRTTGVPVMDADVTAAGGPVRLPSAGGRGDPV